MTCRRFEKQAADWLGRRLSPTASAAMARHRDTCAACRRTAAAESRLRDLWQAEAALPPADLWPRVAARIGGEIRERGKSLRVRARRPAWVLAAALLASFGASQFGAAHWLARRPGPSPDHMVRAGREAALPAQMLPGIAPPDPWTTWSDGAQSNPTVDDPVGADMEPVWTYLKTEHK